jgi:histidinol-phosphate phosphatase family protein
MNTFETLFLDRDGVINKHRPSDYVKDWNEFEFIPGILEEFSLLSNYFRYIIVVTNQRGVGKGLMTEEKLNEIHQKMVAVVKEHGGRIDKIYYCTALPDTDPNRKPNIGMALQAKQDFPDIDFSKSIMVGDSESDKIFAQKAGMKYFAVQEDLKNIWKIII